MQRKSRIIAEWERPIDPKSIADRRRRRNQAVILIAFVIVVAIVIVL